MPKGRMVIDIALLGKLVDSSGSIVPEDKLKAIADLHFPTTLKQLESFLGMTGALRHRIERYDAIIAPLESRKTAE